jgi:hypothetical protein
MWQSESATKPVGTQGCFVIAERGNDHIPQDGFM